METQKKSDLWAGLVWWATLTVAVLAVPSIGLIIALSLGKGELGMMAAFVVTCWVSVWLGMWLVRKADRHHAR